MEPILPPGILTFASKSGRPLSKVRSRSEGKVRGQGQNSGMQWLISLLPCFKFEITGQGKKSCQGYKSRSGQGQGQGQRSRSKFWHAVVNIRGLALLSATKSKEESLLVQGVCLCAE